MNFLKYANFHPDKYMLDYMAAVQAHNPPAQFDLAKRMAAALHETNLVEVDLRTLHINGIQSRSQLRKFARQNELDFATVPGTEYIRFRMKHEPNLSRGQRK